MFDAMERGDLTALYVIGENPMQSEADRHRTEHLLRGLDFIVVQDIFLTATAEIADVVLPAAAAWSETEGTVTNSERRVQRVRRAVTPPGEARDDLAIIFALAKRLGRDWGEPSAEAVWNELRTLSPVHGGMSYARLEAEGGLQWPCYDEQHPGELFLHSRLWEDPVPGNRVPFVAVEHDPPVDKLDDDFPIRLTTGATSTPTTRASRPAGIGTRGGAARRWTSRRRTSSGWACARASGSAWSPGAGSWRRRCGSTPACARASRS